MTPLPPELAAPAPDADAYVDGLVDRIVVVASDGGLAVEEAAVQMADTLRMADSDPGPWRVTDEGSAEWAARHVAQATAEIQRLEAQAVEWAARIDHWFTQASAPLKAKRAFMEAHLERYALGVRKADEKRKSVKLPSATIRTTAKAPRVVVVNEHAALVWAETHAPEAVARDPRLKVGELRQHVEPRQLVTEARFTHSCGCVFDIVDPEGLSWPPVGSEVECPTCQCPVLLGRVDVLVTRWVLSADVPGVDVDPGGVTAKVVLT